MPRGSTKPAATLHWDLALFPPLVPARHADPNRALLARAYNQGPKASS
jgi:hypothetical protein